MSAVLPDGEESRRSERIYFDLLQLQADILVSIGEGWTYDWGDNGHDSLDVVPVRYSVEIEGTEPIETNGVSLFRRRRAARRGVQRHGSRDLLGP